jgi:uncharacterized protein (DUF2235 family)
LAKRIVICADGTWNRPEEDLQQDFPTSVLRLARAITPIAADGLPQQVFYDWGIGSYHNALIGGVTGQGLHKNILDGYRYLVQNYAPGDEIYLFGFSRGAYTVRALCGLINNCGILKRVDAARIQQGFEHYKNPETAHLKARSLWIFAQRTAIRPGRFVLLACGIRLVPWVCLFP